LSIFIIPYGLPGTAPERFFFDALWPAALVLLAPLLGLDLFYCLNSRLLSLLEREDWPALAQYLEKRVLKEGRYRPILVRLLVNTYLVLADSAAIISLENKLALVKPSLVDANLLTFAAARILSRDYAGAARFLEGRTRAPQAEAAGWPGWYYGFALLLDRRFPEAAVQFAALALNAAEPAVIGLSACFLAENLAGALPDRRLELTAAAMDGKNRLKKAFPRRETWERQISRTTEDAHIAILSTYIGQTTGWLYG
jgi:hypothetical protein